MRLGWIAVSCGLLLLGPIGCGEDDEPASSASLKPRLLPVSQVPGFRVTRSLDWSDPSNLVGEGFLLPQSTRPSEALDAVTEAGFDGAFGQILHSGTGPHSKEMVMGVVRLGDAASAKELRDWMHDQNLRQPCLQECIFDPQEEALESVPESRVVAHVPNLPAGEPEPPPGEGPPTRYFAEFTIGRHLYFASSDAGPGKSEALDGFKDYYDHVRDLPAD